MSSAGSKIRDWFSTRTARTIITILSIAGLILLGFVFTRRLIDFPVYYTAGHSLLQGRTDLYSPDFAIGQVMDYRYPPLFLLLFVPLCFLPYKVAAFIWYLLSVVQLGLCFMMLRRIAGGTSKKAWIVAILACAQYIVMILHYGNAHLAVTTLMFAGLYFAINRRETAAAFFLSFAITIKLTPVLVLPYFVVTGRWRLLTWMIPFLLALNLAPAAYFGLEGNFSLLAKWFEHVVINQEFHEVNGPINLSLKGQLRRSFSDVEYEKRVEGDTGYPDVNFLSAPAAQVDVIWLIAASFALFGVLLLLFVRSRRQAETSRHQEALELGLMICLMLFIGPLTSKIYFLALLWPMLVMSTRVFRDTSSVSSFSKVGLILISVMNVVLPLLPGRTIQRLFLVLGMDFYVTLLLILILILEVTRVIRSNRQPGVEERIQDRLSARTS